MTTSTHFIRLADPADVLAAVPHLLGFTPASSVVAIGLRESGDSASCKLTMRADLPAPGNGAELAEYLAGGPLANPGTTGVFIVLVGDGDQDGSPPGDATDQSTSDDPQLPHAELAEQLRGAFREAGIVVWHVIWTLRLRAGEPWRCYGDHTCFGDIADPKGSELGATLAASGLVTFDSRQDLEQLVAPESEEVRARWSAKLNELFEDAERDPATPRRSAELVLGAIRRTAAGEALTEQDQLRVLLAISDSRVRDVCLSASLGDDSVAAEQLWTALVRKAPEPEVADVAALLAFSAYLRGEGALANVALERIEECRPEHPLGGLLRAALEVGIEPRQLVGVAADAVEDAKIAMEEDEAE